MVHYHFFLEGVKSSYFISIQAYYLLPDNLPLISSEILLPNNVTLACLWLDIFHEQFFSRSALSVRIFENKIWGIVFLQQYFHLCVLPLRIIESQSLRNLRDFLLKPSIQGVHLYLKTPEIHNASVQVASHLILRTALIFKHFSVWSSSPMSLELVTHWSWFCLLEATTLVIHLLFLD